jgi:hypothetical protein
MIRGVDELADGRIVVLVEDLLFAPSTKASSLEQRSSIVRAENVALTGRVDLRQFNVQDRSRRLANFSALR